MRLGETFYGGETQAHAFVRLMGPAREWLEDGRVEVRWNARTAVFNFEPQTAVQQFRPHADAPCLLLSHVPDGITYEILQDAGENGTATCCVHLFVGLDDEGDSLLLRNVGSIRCDISQHFGKGATLVRGGFRSRSRQGQKSLHELSAPLQSALGAIAMLLCRPISVPGNHTPPDSNRLEGAQHIARHAAGEAIELGYA